LATLSRPSVAGIAAGSQPRRSRNYCPSSFKPPWSNRLDKAAAITSTDINNGAPAERLGRRFHSNQLKAKPGIPSGYNKEQKGPTK
jgi:hypothetical protein